MPHTGPTEDRLAIRELLDSYGDAVCRHDADAWIANWAPDARWSIRANEVIGREAIRAYWVKAMAAYRFINFSSYPGAIEVNGHPLKAGDALLMEQEDHIALSHGIDAEVIVFDLAA